MAADGSTGAQGESSVSDQQGEFRGRPKDVDTASRLLEKWPRSAWLPDLERDELVHLIAEALYKERIGTGCSWPHCQDWG
jgi:hypothetical protein